MNWGQGPAMSMYWRSPSVTMCVSYRSAAPPSRAADRPSGFGSAERRRETGSHEISPWAAARHQPGDRSVSSRSEASGAPGGDGEVGQPVGVVVESCPSTAGGAAGRSRRCPSCPGTAGIGLRVGQPVGVVVDRVPAGTRRRRRGRSRRCPSLSRTAGIGLRVGQPVGVVVDRVRARGCGRRRGAPTDRMSRRAAGALRRSRGS